LGLVLLLRGRLGQLHLSMWLDGLVSGLSTAAVVAALAFDAITRGTTGSPLGIATNLAYPCGDLLLFILVVGVFGLTGWRPGWGWLLLGAGLLIWGVAD